MAHIALYPKIENIGSTGSIILGSFGDLHLSEVWHFEPLGLFLTSTGKSTAVLGLDGPQSHDGCLWDLRPRYLGYLDPLGHSAAGKLRAQLQTWELSEATYSPRNPASTPG